MKFPEQFRLKFGSHATNPGEPFGAFLIPSHHAKGRTLGVICSDGRECNIEEWEHVSVSLPENKSKCPSWEEMCLVKSLFWEDSECVVQFHPPKSDYVNHAQVLHLWKPVNATIPLPPKVCV